MSLKSIAFALTGALALYAMMNVGWNVAPVAGKLEARVPGLGYAMLAAWLAVTFSSVAGPLYLAQSNGWLRRNWYFG